jgi:hypothetical protein
VKKSVFTLGIICLVLSLITVGVFAKSHRVEFLQKAVINGVEIEPGKYTMKMNGDNQVEFYSGKALVATAKAELQPIGDATPNSVIHKADGTVTEIRLKNERVVIATS